MRVLFFFVAGGILGFLVCKYFVLSGSELTELSLFWNNMGTNRMQDAEALVKSAGFLKTFAGIILGGFAGALFSGLFGND